MAPEICPICGALVPRNARACPECGADDETGWSDRAKAQQLGIPDDEFDYEDFVQEEFGNQSGRPRPRPSHRRIPNWVWVVVALGLIILFLWGILRALHP